MRQLIEMDQDREAQMEDTIMRCWMIPIWTYKTGKAACRLEQDEVYS